MVLAEFFGTAALGASGLWSYNRENFLYDRDMRQEQEFQVIEMKLKQCELWREDVRDMIELTERKMDRYMVVNALQLGFTVTLFTEGRLQPGTPEWLLWLYLLSLASAFLFLLMSVWFAMHASVVAQSNSVRLLTQLVRLPIPSWEQLEATRTYGSAFEGVPAAQMLRVPFVQTISEGMNSGSGSDSKPADPWGLERRGDDIYELQRRPLYANHHMHLVREALRQWQAYDAFARVSMTLGTLMLCFAISYYILGYVLVQDGSAWAAWVAVTIFQSVASMLLRLDMTMSLQEKAIATMLMSGGVVICCIAAAEWATYNASIQWAALALLPCAYMTHIAFLLFFLHLCRVVRHPGGGLFPSGFRAVLYVDVFGWLALRQQDLLSARRAPEPQAAGARVAPQGRPEAGRGAGAAAPEGAPGAAPPAPPQAELLEVDQEAWPLPAAASCACASACEPEGARAAAPARGPARAGAAALPEPSGTPTSYGPGGGAAGRPPRGRAPSAGGGLCREATFQVAHGQSFPRQMHRAAPDALRPCDVELAGFDPDDPCGARSARKDAAAHFHDDLADRRDRDGSGLPPRSLQGVGPAGVVPQPCGRAFEPGSFAPEPGPGAGAARTGHDAFMPGQLPWLAFRSAVWLVAGLWLLGLAWCASQATGAADIPDQVLPESIAISGEGTPEPGVGVAAYRPAETARPLEGGRRVHIEWPTEQFQPTGMSCDMAGRHCAFSDGFQLYSASLGQDLRFTRLRLAPPCLPLEGQALEDVAVHCRADPSGPACSAYVLHGEGRLLAECPLPGPGGAPPSGAAASWQLSHSWLGQGSAPERVTSVALGSACEAARTSAGAAAFPGRGSCFVAGTDRGRAVRLQPSSRRAHQLLPAGAVWRLPVRVFREEVLPSSSPLQILPGGFLLTLDDANHRVHVINMTNTQSLAELQLPQYEHCSWIALAGGRTHLYAMSASWEDESVDLWQFPLSEVLRT